MDFPGHGGSDNAPDPETSYCTTGYADAAISVLQALDIERAVVVGWSLGGHVAIEMMPLFSGLVGIVISGTPPVRPDDMESIAAGFHMNETFHMNGTTALVGQEVWSAEEAKKSPVRLSKPISRRRIGCSLRRCAQTAGRGD